MDNKPTLQNVDEYLKHIKSANSLHEYNDIANDIVKINITLRDGYLWENDYGILKYKKIEDVYKELYPKYINKEEWRNSGFIEQHRMLYSFYGRLPYNGQLNYYMLLSNLKAWIIRYWQYKVIKEKFDEEIEKVFKQISNIQ